MGDNNAFEFSHTVILLWHDKSATNKRALYTIYASRIMNYNYEEKERMR